MQKIGKKYAMYNSVLLAVITLGIPVTTNSNESLEPARQKSAKTTFSTSEKLIVDAIEDIRMARLEEAIEKIDNLTEKRPDFKLAQLIRGDLLLTQGRGISKMGSGLTDQKRTGLLAEARARIVRQKLQPRTNKTPIYPLQIPSRNKYVLMLDGSKSTLYVFKNLGTRLEYETDYYASIGKKGIDKFREGDQKTPLGVYRITRKISKSKLSDFYGAGALPINYPNKWDRIHGKSGYGIWLHGTPLDTYSRAPQSSDGCIVLSNDDYEQMEKYVEPGITLIFITDAIRWANEETIALEKKGIMKHIEQWKKHWESIDTENYLHHYSDKFTYEKGLKLADWVQKKRRINANKKWIRVKISDLVIMLYPGNQKIAMVRFRQEYSSDNLQDKMDKLQFWIQEGKKWKIIYEGV